MSHDTLVLPRSLPSWLLVVPSLPPALNPKSSHFSAVLLFLLNCVRLLSSFLLTITFRSSAHPSPFPHHRGWKVFVDSHPLPALLSLLSQCVVVSHIQCTAMLQAHPPPAAFNHLTHTPRLFQRFIFSPFTLACKCLSFYCLFECFSCSVSSVCPPMCVELFNKPCEQSVLQACLSLSPLSVLTRWPEVNGTQGA